jgi:hypothetical protein
VYAYVPLTPTRTKADYYLNMTFTAGSLAAGATSEFVYAAFSASGDAGGGTWLNFDETNDYSYDVALNGLENLKMTIYKDGGLVRGTEP